MTLPAWMVQNQREKAGNDLQSNNYEHANYPDIPPSNSNGSGYPPPPVQNGASYPPLPNAYESGGIPPPYGYAPPPAYEYPPPIPPPTTNTPSAHNSTRDRDSNDHSRRRGRDYDDHDDSRKRRRDYDEPTPSSSYPPHQTKITEDSSKKPYASSRVGGSDRSTLRARRLYVGSTDGFTEKELQNFFNRVIQEAGGPDNAALAVTVNERNFAFVEFSEVEIMHAVLALGALPYRGKVLKFQKPKDYELKRPLGPLPHLDLSRVQDLEQLPAHIIAQSKAASERNFRPRDRRHPSPSRGSGGSHRDQQPPQQAPPQIPPPMLFPPIPHPYFQPNASAPSQVTSSQPYADQIPPPYLPPPNPSVSGIPPPFGIPPPYSTPTYPPGSAGPPGTGAYPPPPGTGA